MALLRCDVLAHLVAWVLFPEHRLAGGPDVGIVRPLQFG